MICNCGKKGRKETEKVEYAVRSEERKKGDNFEVGLVFFISSPLPRIPSHISDCLVTVSGVIPGWFGWMGG